MWIEIGIASALVGIVHCLVLSEMDTPLNFYYLWLNSIEEKHPRWHKVLGGCVLCFSGQLGLWSSVVLTNDFSLIGIFGHFWSAATAIVASHFISHTWKRVSP